MLKKLLSVSSLVLVLTVIASVVAAAPLLDIPIPDPGEGTSDVIIQNMDGTNDATYVLDYVDAAGLSIAGAQQTGSLKPYVSTGIDGSTVTPLGTGYNGAAIVSSDRQAAAVAVTNWTSGVGGGDGATRGEYAGFESGHTSLSFPYSFNSNRVSWITIQNTGFTEETFYFSFVDRRTGSQTGATTSVAIPARAQRTFPLDDCGSGVVPTGVCTRPSGDVEADYWKGSTLVTTTNSVAAGVATTVWQRPSNLGQWSAQYVGIPDAANELVFPLFFRVKQDAGVFGEDKPWHRYSDLNVYNPDLGSSVAVTISLYSVEGVLSDQWTKTIDPGGSIAVNTRFCGNGSPSGLLGQDCTDGDQVRWAAALQDSLGRSNWLGAAVVTAESGKEVMGICFDFWPQSQQDFVAGYNAVTAEEGGEMLFFPVGRRAYPDAGKPLAYSQFQLQNMEPTTTTVDIYFFDRDQATGGIGNEIYALTGSEAVEIPAYSSRSMNTKFNSFGFPTDWFTNLGTSFHGTAVVVSRGGDLTGVGFGLDISSGAQVASAYNGIVP